MFEVRKNRLLRGSAGLLARGAIVVATRSLWAAWGQTAAATAVMDASAADFDLIEQRHPLTSLDGRWRFHPGDDPTNGRNWADPAFEDSSWPLLRSDASWAEQGFPVMSEYAWYRFTVRIPDTSKPFFVIRRQVPGAHHGRHPIRGQVHKQAGGKALRTPRHPVVQRGKNLRHIAGVGRLSLYRPHQHRHRHRRRQPLPSYVSHHDQQPLLRRRQDLEDISTHFLRRVIHAIDSKARHLGNGSSHVGQAMAVRESVASL